MFRIKELRLAKGISMKDTARMLEMPYTTYVNYEKGLREPGIDVLIQFANFYGTTVDYIVGRCGENANANQKNLMRIIAIGDKIKSLRKAMGLNQTELGKRLGVKTNAVSKWECGRVEDIPTAKIKAMSVLFDVPVSYLIDDNVLCSTVLDLNDVPFYQEYQELPADDQETVRQIVHVMHDRRKKENPPQD